MRTTLQDLIFAARLFRRTPGIVLLAVAALALGIGANTAVFSVVNAVLLRPLPYHDPRGLYDLTAIDAKGRASAFSMADFLALRDHNQSFAGISTANIRSLTLSGAGKEAERVYADRVTEDCFRILGVPSFRGRGFVAADFRPGALPVAVLSYRLWQRRYAGDPQIAGRTILIDGEAFTIAGVMPPQFEYRQKLLELWLPWIPSADIEARNDHGRTLLTRLKPGVTIAQAQAELDAFAASMSTQIPEDKNWRPHIGPTKLGSADQFRPQLLVLLGATGFVLLIACLNVANLLLARAAGRQREIAVRIAIGASRGRIVRQLLTESFLLAMLGSACGLLLAAWGQRALIALFPAQIPLPHLDRVGIDRAVLLFALALTFITALIFGLVPAIQLSRTGIYGTLKTARGSWPRNALIVAETALSLILLAGAGLMLRSFSKLLDAPTGFHPEHVLTLQVPVPGYVSGNGPRTDFDSREASKFQQILTHVESLPGVTAAGLVTVLPLGPVETKSSIFAEGETGGNDDYRVQFRAASPEYFRAMGISLLAGRTFTDADTRDAPGVAIVNDALARRYWPNQNAVGKRLTTSGKPVPPWLTVVGVVAGIRHRSLAEEPEPELYRPYLQFLGPAFGAAVVVRSAVRGAPDPSTLTAAIRHEIHALYPEQPTGEARLMTQVVADSASQPRFYTLLLGVFAALALVLAAAGIYGVMSCSVAQRTSEVGIRIALGASSRDVFSLILGRGMLWVFTGIALGLAGSAALTRLIASQLYETSPTDPATLIEVSAALLCIALAAAYPPARRATRVDPIVALRTE